jgi:hypothetical protein
MQRILQAELLDSLPPDHPDALHNRRDLRVINHCMGNYGWFARTLPTLLRPGEAALELGAGDGTLGLRLAARGVAIDGLDLWPRPTGWPAAREWHRADLRTFADYGRYPVVAGNLIFHQFSEPELAELGAILRRQARTIVVCEPLRRRFSQTLLAVLGPLLGAGAVTRHDGPVSVAAGFRGDELPRALGLRDDAWAIRCSQTALGAFRMVATRRP